MSNNLYIAAAEAKAGKSLIAMGFMELLSRHVKKIGFFRPIVRSEEEMDSHIKLISERYKLPFGYQDMYGLTSNQALQLNALVAVMSMPAAVRGPPQSPTIQPSASWMATVSAPKMLRRMGMVYARPRNPSSVSSSQISSPGRMRPAGR